MAAKTEPNGHSAEQSQPSLLPLDSEESSPLPRKALMGPFSSVMAEGSPILVRCLDRETIVIELTTDELVIDVRHILQDIAPCCFITHFHMLYKERELDDFEPFKTLLDQHAAETKAQPSDPASLFTVRIVPARYDEKAVRFHIHRFRAILNDPELVILSARSYDAERKLHENAEVPSGEDSTTGCTPRCEETCETGRGTVARSGDKAETLDTLLQEFKALQAYDTALCTGPDGSKMLQCQSDAQQLFKNAIAPALFSVTETNSKKKCVVAVRSSMWNPPPRTARLRGHLWYIDIDTLEGQTLCVIGTPGGFQLWDTLSFDSEEDRETVTSSKKCPWLQEMDSETTAFPTLHHFLLAHSKQYSKTIASIIVNTQALMDFNLPYKLSRPLSTTHRWVAASQVLGVEEASNECIPARQRLENVELALEQPLRVDPWEPVREWNEDFQCVREMLAPRRSKMGVDSPEDAKVVLPSDSNDEPLMTAFSYERNLSKFSVELAWMSLKGAMNVREGLIACYTGLEPDQSENSSAPRKCDVSVYSWNNLLFVRNWYHTSVNAMISEAPYPFDKTNTLRTITPMEFCERKGMLADYRGMQLAMGMLSGTASNYLTGGDGVPETKLSPLTVQASCLVNYAGMRIMSQTLLPGLLVGESGAQPVLGSMAWNTTYEDKETDVIRALEEGLTKPLGLKKETFEFGPQNQKVSASWPLETKVLRGADGRHYITDLGRVLPPDLNWFNAEELTTLQSGAFESSFRDAIRIKVCTKLVRPELWSAYLVCRDQLSPTTVQLRDRVPSDALRETKAKARFEWLKARGCHLNPTFVAHFLVPIFGSSESTAPEFPELWPGLDFVLGGGALQRPSLYVQRQQRILEVVEQQLTQSGSLTIGELAASDNASSSSSSSSSAAGKESTGRRRSRTQPTTASSDNNGESVENRWATLLGLGWQALAQHLPPPDALTSVCRDAKSAGHGSVTPNMVLKKMILQDLASVSELNDLPNKNRQVASPPCKKSQSDPRRFQVQLPQLQENGPLSLFNPNTMLDDSLICPDERLRNIKELQLLASYLKHVAVVRLADHLLGNGPEIPVESSELASLFHAFGVNMRYLGHVIKEIQQRALNEASNVARTTPAYVCEVLERDIVARCITRYANAVLATMPFATLADVISHIFNLVFAAPGTNIDPPHGTRIHGSADEGMGGKESNSIQLESSSDAFWTAIHTLAVNQFAYAAASLEEFRNGALTLSHCRFALLRTISVKLGLRVSLDATLGVLFPTSRADATRGVSLSASKENPMALLFKLFQKESEASSSSTAPSGGSSPASTSDTHQGSAASPMSAQEKEGVPLFSSRSILDITPVLKDSEAFSSQIARETLLAGSICHAFDDLEAAFDCYQTVTHVLHQVNLQHSQNCLYAQHATACALVAVGDFISAASHLENVVLILERAFGPDHPRLIHTRLLLSRLYLAIAYTPAETLYVLEQRQKRFAQEVGSVSAEQGGDEETIAKESDTGSSKDAKSSRRQWIMLAVAYHFVLLSKRHAQRAVYLSIIWSGTNAVSNPILPLLLTHAAKIAMYVCELATAAQKEAKAHPLPEGFFGTEESNKDGGDVNENENHRFAWKALYALIQDEERAVDAAANEAATLLEISSDLCASAEAEAPGRDVYFRVQVNGDLAAQLTSAGHTRRGLAAVQRQRNLLGRILGPDHPDVTTLNKEVAALASFAVHQAKQERSLSANVDTLFKLLCNNKPVSL